MLKNKGNRSYNCFFLFCPAYCAYLYHILVHKRSIIKIILLNVVKQKCRRQPSRIDFIFYFFFLIEIRTDRGKVNIPSSQFDIPEILSQKFCRHRDYLLVRVQFLFFYRFVMPLLHLHHHRNHDHCYQKP